MTASNGMKFPFALVTRHVCAEHEKGAAVY